MAENVGSRPNQSERKAKNSNLWQARENTKNVGKICSRCRAWKNALDQDKIDEIVSMFVR